MRACGLGYVSGAMFLILLVLSAGWAQALEVRVLGQGTIDLRARSAGTVLQVEGQLVDENGAGQPLRDLELSLRRGQALMLQEVITTDYEGRFQWSEEYSPGSYQVSLRYGGGSHITAAEASETVRLEARSAELAVHGPGWIHGQDLAGLIRVQATVGGVPLSSSYVHIAPRGRPQVTVALGPDGRGSFEVGSELRPGPNHVRVELEGSSYRSRAAWDLLIRRSEWAELGGEAEVVFRRLERGLEVTLELSDHDGGIEGARIDVLIEQKEGEEGRLKAPLSRRGRTDPRGRAHVFFGFEEIGHGPWQISAQALPSEGDPVIWEGMEFRRQGSLFERLSRWMGIIAMVAGVVWLTRQALSLVIQALGQRLARRRRAGESGSLSAQLFADFEELAPEIVEGVALDVVADTGDESAPRLVVQLFDEWEAQPVAGALVQADGEEGSFERRSSSQGQVVFDELAAGRWRLRVTAWGYVPGEVEVMVPGLRGVVRLNLTPVPLKIRRMYRWMVQQSGGDDYWGRLTPRQIQAALLGEQQQGDQEHPQRDWQKLLQEWQGLGEEERLVALFQAITALVEETNFSGERYDQQVWEVARGAMKELATLLEVERGGQGV